MEKQFNTSDLVNGTIDFLKKELGERGLSTREIPDFKVEPLIGNENIFVPWANEFDWEKATKALVEMGFAVTQKIVPEDRSNRRMTVLHFEQPYPQWLFEDEDRPVVIQISELNKVFNAALEADRMSVMNGGSQGLTPEEFAFIHTLKKRYGIE